MGIFFLLTSLTVLFGIKICFCRLFQFFPHKKRSKTCQNRADGKFEFKKMWWMNHFSSWLNFCQKTQIPNIVIPRNFSEKFFIAQNPHELFEIHRKDRLWSVSVWWFKIFSGVLAFGVFTGISTTPKNKVNAAWFICMKTGCKIGILSEDKLIQAYLPI